MPVKIKNLDVFIIILTVVLNMDYFYIISYKENFNLKFIMLKKGLIELYLENIFMGIVSSVVLLSTMYSNLYDIEID